jgi:hypothetical protein
VLLIHREHNRRLRELRTVNRRCQTMLRHHKEPLGLDDLGGLDRGNIIETAMGKVFMHELMKEDHATAASYTLQHCAITVESTLPRDDVQSYCWELVAIFPPGETYMYALQPTVQSRPAIEIKKEMLEQYAVDDYHFLQDHIDIMLVPSTMNLLSEAHLGLPCTIYVRAVITQKAVFVGSHISIQL